MHIALNFQSEEYLRGCIFPQSQASMVVTQSEESWEGAWLAGAELRGTDTVSASSSRSSCPNWSEGQLWAPQTGGKVLGPAEE